MNYLFCFGLGYVAQRHIYNLNKNYPNQWLFYGTTSRNINLTNCKTFYFDDSINLPDEITHILISIPPQNLSDIVYEKFINQLTKLKNLKWIGYFSSTSVYGNHEGRWVDESSSVNRISSISKSRLNAEDRWLEAFSEYKLPIHIFRLSGIYGPRRSPLEKALDGSLKIINLPNAVFSRVHVDDISNIIYYSQLNLNPGSVYNIADDYPSSPNEVAEYVCKLLNIKIPRSINIDDANLSEMGKSFYSNFKRVSNKKVKDELIYNFIYPSYKEGLLDIAKECGYIT